MAPSIDSAEDYCDALNARLGLYRDAWKPFDERVFATQVQLSLSC